MELFNNSVARVQERDAELKQLHEHNGVLGLEVQKVKEELATLAADRTHDEPFRRQLDSIPTENHQDYDQLLESSSTTIDNQRKVVALLQSRLREEREEREKVEAQVAELKQNPQPQPQHQLYAKIEELEERNRLLSIKSREERQKLEEKIKTLEYRDESQSRRLAEKQNRLDELESVAELQQKSATANKDLPEAANVLKKLRKALGKKSTASLADVEKILEIIEGDGNE